MKKIINMSNFLNKQTAYLIGSAYKSLGYKVIYFYG